MSRKALKKAVRLAGSQTKLAAKISVVMKRKIRQGTISAMLLRYKCEVPTPDFVIPIEKALNSAITRYELRPDLYPPEEIGKVA